VNAYLAVVFHDECDCERENDKDADHSRIHPPAQTAWSRRRGSTFFTRRAHPKIVAINAATRPRFATHGATSRISLAAHLPAEDVAMRPGRRRVSRDARLGRLRTRTRVGVGRAAEMRGREI
jgi:hypothetical protein